jgi:hypothetical protein
MVMNLHHKDLWHLEFFLIPPLFTLTGLCLLMTLFTPAFRWPITYNINMIWVLWLSGTLFSFTGGIWLLHRRYLHTNATTKHNKPNYKTANILFAILLFAVGILIFTLATTWWFI